MSGCDTEPTMQIGFDYHEDLTIEKVDKILDKLE
ncbi:MAG: NAD(P)H-dependent oxidoreductase subunit E [Acidobacteria bacterium]|nr:NAD(P)H-dependent oxidoreductase subunit E [Acidobacteriota bacterium]